MITVAQFKDILISKSGGKPLGKVANFYSILWQAMTKVKSKVDLPSAMRTAQLTNPVYTDITQYPLPADIALNGIVTLRPIKPDDTYYDFRNLNQRQLTVEQKFDYTSKRYGVRNINGVQTLKIVDQTTSPVVIQAGDISSNGAVTAVGATINVATEYLQVISGASSIGFDVGIGASNGIKDLTMAAVDLSAQKDILYWIFIPSLTNLSALTLKLGQSASAYYQGTTAVDFFGNPLAVGWNLIRIPKTSFTVGAGSPTWTGIVYFELDIIGTYVAGIAGFRFDSLVGQIGAIFEIDYYSDYQFQTLAGVRIIKPSLDSDYIIIAGDEIDLFTDQFIEIMTVDLKQQGVQVDYQEYGGNKLQANYDAFKMKHPSQRQLMTTTYGSSPQGRINS